MSWIGYMRRFNFEVKIQNNVVNAFLLNVCVLSLEVYRLWRVLKYVEDAIK